MEMLAVKINWLVIIIVGVLIILLLVFINRRNRKDEEDMEETMNQVDQKFLDHKHKDSEN